MVFDTVGPGSGGVVANAGGCYGDDNWYDIGMGSGGNIVGCGSGGVVLIELF